MKARAVFYWNSTSKKIAWMILDDRKFSVLAGGNEMNCNAMQTGKAKRLADSEIQIFLDEVQKLQQSGYFLKCHYKTVSPATTVSFIGGRRRGRNRQLPHELSVHVHNALTKGLTTLGVDTHRTRSDLVGPALLDFKSTLAQYQTITPAYMHRLWAVTVKAIAKNYPKGLLEIWKKTAAPAGVRGEAAKKDFLKQFPRYKGKF